MNLPIMILRLLTAINILKPVILLRCSTLPGHIYAKLITIVLADNQDTNTVLQAQFSIANVSP